VNGSIGIEKKSFVISEINTVWLYVPFQVNTASRLESNGEALKIHISDECRTVLDTLGGYIIKERYFFV